MEKIFKFLDGLTSEELEMFERDLKDGHIHKFVNQKKEFFKIEDKVCPVCGNKVEADCYVLMFGEPSLRKKAHFCGHDCLEYFIKNYLKGQKPYKKKQQTNNKLTEENEE